jgi:hypothetical protein
MLAVCLCFKDSAEYLQEWLLFHHVQGFTRFYLYNNGSTDGWREVVQPWVEAGLVETFDYPGLGVQNEIYADCLKRARGSVEWLAFLDDDEFLFPNRDEPLARVLPDYAAHAGVAVSWMLYGSSGAERKSPEWVIQRFRRTNGIADHHVKCIVQPERVRAPNQIGHSFFTEPGFEVVDENFVPLRDPLNPKATAARLRINHYLVKSWEEWRFRRNRPQANTGLPTPLPEQSWRGWDVAWSQVLDESALRFLPLMKQVEARFPRR